MSSFISALRLIRVSKLATPSMLLLFLAAGLKFYHHASTAEHLLQNHKLVFAQISEKGRVRMVRLAFFFVVVFETKGKKKRRSWIN